MLPQSCSLHSVEAHPQEVQNTETVIVFGKSKTLERFRIFLLSFLSFCVSYIKTEALMGNIGKASFWEWMAPSKAPEGYNTT